MVSCTRFSLKKTTPELPSKAPEKDVQNLNIMLSSKMIITYWSFAEIAFMVFIDSNFSRFPFNSP